MSASSFSRSFTASSAVAMISLLGSVLEVIEKLMPFAKNVFHLRFFTKCDQIHSFMRILSY